MLYDRRWDYKVDPLSRESLIGWLETQPADGTYIHTFGDVCIIWQWLRDVAPGSFWISGYEYSVNGDRHNFLHLKEISCGDGPKDWTFGAALARARRGT